MKVPRFQLDRTLGSGSTGEVLHGLLLDDCGHLAAGSEVAVKYLHANLANKPQAALAFEREAETALTVRHSGLVRAVATGTDERGPFIVMEFVPGQTLREVLQERGPLPEPTLRSVAVQVAGGLAALHEAGYIHGDVKPENVRLDGTGRAVLVDLGFARRPSQSGISLGSPAPSADSTQSGTRAAGTLLYLAPERLRGEAARAASDIYALGLVLFELATGSHPFSSQSETPESGIASSKLSSGNGSLEDATLQHVVERTLRGQASPASVLNPILSPFLDEVVAACLAQTVEARPEARKLHEIFAEGEASSWWRERVDFEATTRAAVRSRHHLTPLVGRSSDISRLRGLAEACLSSPPNSPGTVLWIEGEVGAGKTRIAGELVSRVRSRPNPPMFLYGRCTRVRENRPCQPLLRMLQRYLGLPRAGIPSERDREHLRGLVPPREATTLLRALDPHGVEGTPVSVPAALASWLLALGERHSVLLFVDDLHNADAETLRALTLAAEDLEHTPMVLLLAVGTDEVPRHENSLSNLQARYDASANLHRLPLGKLNERDVQSLVDNLFDHPSPRLRLGAILWRQSLGQPGFLAELLRGMVGRGDMQHSTEEQGRYSLTVAPNALPRPASLSIAVGDSLRALADGDRLWLQRLSVVGRKIQTDYLLRAFTPSTQAEVDEVLARLVQSNWLVPDGNRFRFSQPTTRETVYRSLSADRRKRLHANAARALKPEAHTAISIADAFQRAFHLQASGQHAELLLVLRPLVQRLASSGMPQRVRRLSSWGLDALDALEPTKERQALQLDLLEYAADAASRLGNREDQRSLLDRIASRDEDEQNPKRLGRVYLLHGRYAASTGQLGLARGWFSNAASLFASAGDEPLRSECLRRLSFVQGLAGNLEDSRTHARAALNAAGDDRRLTGLAQLALATVSLLRDRLEQALGHTNRATSKLRGVRGESVGGALAQAQVLRARIYRSLGRPVRALGAASRGLQLARQSGERLIEAEAGARLGGLLLYTGRVEEAEARLRDALLLADEVEDKNSQCLASLFLGVLLAEDERSETRKRLAACTRLAVQASLHRAEALSLAIESRLDLQESRLERAEVGAKRALFIVGQYGAELFDRVVIEGTAALIASAGGNESQAEELERGLRRRLKRESARIGSDLLQRRHRGASNRLLETVLSREGPLYPRLNLSEA